MTASELVALGRRLEALEKPKAKGRQRRGLRQGDRTPSASGDADGGCQYRNNRTDCAVADALGVSKSTVNFVRSVERDDALSLLMAERDENTCRKEMTASELVALGRRLEALEKPKAKERQRDGQRRGRDSRFGSASGDAKPNRVSQYRNNPTDCAVADALGVSKSTYQRQKYVVAAMEDENPAVADVAKEQLAQLNSGGTSVSAAARTVSRTKKDAVDFADPQVDAEVDEPTVIPGVAAGPKSGPRHGDLQALSSRDESAGPAAPLPGKAC